MPSGISFVNALHRRIPLAMLLAGLAGIGLLCDEASAQFGRQRGGDFRGRSGGFNRGGGGFARGFGGGGLLFTLRGEDVQAELGLSEEQQQQIEELRDEARPDDEAQASLREREQAAETDEQREAVQAERRQLYEDYRTRAEAKLKDVLSAEQLTRANQVYLQQAGTRAFERDEIAAELKLTESQREQLTQLQADREQASFALGFRASREEREQLQQDWDAKALELLTAEQRTEWHRKLGPPMQTASAQDTGDLSRGSDDRGRGSDDNGSDDSEPSQQPAYEEPVSEGPVVASFGEEADAADGRPVEELSFNFRYAPWTDVLKMFADAAGLTLDLNDPPPGTFNYYTDKGKYNPEEALDVINGYLLQKGYVLVKRDQFLVSLNIDNPIPPNLVPNVSVEELPRRGRNELLSIVLPLDEIEAETAAQEVEALLGPQGKVVALAASNSLVVTDIGHNLRRVYGLLQNVTVKPDPDAVTFRAFHLQYIPAADAERIVRSVLGMSQSVPNVSAASSGSSFGFGRSDDRSRYSSYGRGDYGRGDSRDSRDSRGSSSSRGGSTSAGNVQVASDLRTNSLLITATAAQLQIVEQAIEVIDTAEAGRAVATDNSGPYLKVYTVESSDPREVTKTIDALMPGIVVNEDGRYDRIHIFATPAEHREVETLIRQLDGLGGGQNVAVIPLVRLDPLEAAGSLRALFLRDGENAPTIEPDLLGRRLLLRGTPDQLTQVRTVLTQLGEDGTGQLAGNPGLRGPVRTLSLGGRDAEQFGRLIERLWQASNPNPIRVSVPSQANPIRDRRVPSEPEDNREAGDDGEPRAEVPVPLPVQTVSQFIQVQDSGDEIAEDEIADDELPNNNQPRDPVVSVTISGGSIVISSTDLEALDRLEQLIDDVARTIPVKTTWTVFYLRTADAAETAAMLEQLFPASSVGTAATAAESGLLGGLTGGISSFGQSLMDMSGLADLGTGPMTLRIIPEVRSNALFVTGPVDQVRDVEQMLKILDANELPESLRDRLPRMIPIEYADANDVAVIVRDVYSDFLESPNSRRSSGRGNPLEMLMGGGSRSGGNQRGQSVPEVRLTLGVDSNTNQLVVSANDALFREIEVLVQSLDQAANQAQRTVRVVPLVSSDATEVQQALVSLIPKVSVSVSGQSSSRSSGSQSSSSASQRDNGGGPSSDDVRRIFEQRMRERMEQMRGGGGDGGRGSFDRGSSDRSRFGGGGFPGRSGGGFGDRGRGFGDRGRD